MTTDAFEKAQEINKKIHVADCLMSIISNFAITSDSDIYHNKHVIDDKVVLCYMYKPRDPINDSDMEVDNVSNLDGDIIKGCYCINDFILGKNVPTDLVEKLENAISDYIMKLRKEFEELAKPKTSHWIKEEFVGDWDGRSYVCPECGRSIQIDLGFESLNDYPYCHCGAKMVDSQEERNKK